MTSERWHQIETLYHRALELEKSRRTVFLRDACAGDRGLQDEVERLLAEEQKAGSFLEEPAFEGAARELAQDRPGSGSLHLKPGIKLGQYEVREQIGQGGMGEVYRGYDSQLKRDVALKVLPDPFLRDSERLSRFRREAAMLASLNHPNIAAIHRLEESGGTYALVMEYVPGETLQERIRRKGAIPSDEALDIARQICEALEHAHEHGVIHRDLKPANVKITPDGKVKVLDFGLAKAFSSEPGPVDNHDASTTSVMPTEPGRILGTPAYMSPEQAQGKAVDKRTDIWAFGCVYYELLTGKRAFPGDNVSQIIATVLRNDPDWGNLPSNTPETVREVLERCIEKHPDRRRRDIRDVRLDLERESRVIPKTASEAVVTTRTGWGRKWVVAIAVALVFVATAILALRQSPPASSSAVLRLVLPLTADERLIGFSRPAISPDGTHIAIIGSGGGISRIFLHSLDDLEAKPLPGTEGASPPGPVFSPDGRWIAFVAQAKLKKVPISGGQPVIIGDASGGIYWANDGTILFVPSGRGGIFRVSENGGEPQAITTLDTENGETSHRMPILLPGGKAILYTTYGTTYRDVKIVAQSLSSGEKKVVVDGGSQPSFVSSGHLLYLQPSLPGTVLAATFDPVRLELTGTPVRVVDDVFTDQGDRAQWAVSRDGQLVYAAGGLQGRDRELVWADRMGNSELLPFPLRPYEYPRVSPDGSRVLVALDGLEPSIWMLNLADTTLARMTFEGNNRSPLWMPDGQRIVYASLWNGAYTPFWKAADGNRKEEPILPEQSSGAVETISPDGKVSLAYCGEGPISGICTVALDGSAKKTPFDLSPGIDQDTQFSPDGKWLTYSSNESGVDEIYVIPFPGRGERRQISSGGGREPRWAKNGRELFYRQANSMMSVEISTDPAFRSGTPRELFAGPYDRTDNTTPNYDVSADGQRFLMIRRAPQETPPLQLNFVLNWFEELKQKVPIGK